MFENKNYLKGSIAFPMHLFTARDLLFDKWHFSLQNTAVAIKNQLVAIYSASDQSVFYISSIEGYQDSLYSDSLRQYYRECVIYGAGDFIIRFPATVIQSGFILPRKPLPGHENVISSHKKCFSRG